MSVRKFASPANKWYPQSRSVIVSRKRDMSAVSDRATEMGSCQGFAFWPVDARNTGLHALAGTHIGKDAKFANFRCCTDSDGPGHHTVFKSKCNAIAVARGERATNNGGFLSSLCHGLSQAANAAPASMYAWRCQNCSLSALSAFLDRCPPHLRCELDLSFVHALQTGAVILQ